MSNEFGSVSTSAVSNLEPSSRRIVGEMLVKLKTQNSLLKTGFNNS
jgi:hypothetical protein